MKVVLIAHTTMMGIDDIWNETPYTIQENAPWMDQLAEFAGRACYESWRRPNPVTGTNATYLEHIIEVGHESVLEHASASFYVTGVSRSLLAELTRHRHLSFSVRSQRYVDESEFKYVFPPALTAPMKTSDPSHQLVEVATVARNAYDILVDRLITAGFERKKAREAARCVLPQATETRFVVTGNMRAWRDVLRKRLHPGADAEIQQLARQILARLVQIAPHTFQDCERWDGITDE